MYDNNKARHSINAAILAGLIFVMLTMPFMLVYAIYTGKWNRDQFITDIKNIFVEETVTKEELY